VCLISGLINKTKILCSVVYFVKIFGKNVCLTHEI
jgi:hypothetical protein